MRIVCKNSVECSPSKSATDKKGAGDHNQVVADLPLDDSSKAQTPRETVKPGKKLDLPANSRREVSQKKQRKNRGTKGSVQEVDKKLDVTVTEAKPSQDKEDATNAKKEEPAQYEYFDYRVYLAESDEGYTEVVRKHKPRRSVSSLDKTSSNKDGSSSTDTEKRKKESRRSKGKSSATNTDVKKKENSPQNKGKSSTANPGNMKKEPTSTKETARNSKRSAPGSRSKAQSHTASTRMTDLSTSRPSAKNPNVEKHQPSDKSNSSHSDPSSTSSTPTVPSVSKPFLKGITKSFSSVVAGTNASSTTTRSRIIWNSSIGNTSAKKIASVSDSGWVKNSTQKPSQQSSRGVVKLSNQSQPDKKQPEKNQEICSRPFDETATYEDEDVGFILQKSTHANSLEKSTSSESSVDLLTNSSHASSIQSLLGVNDDASTHSDLEKKQELVSSTSDERASSEDSDDGSTSLQPHSNSSEKSTSSESSVDLLTNSSHALSIQSLLGFNNESSTQSNLEKEQELVRSSSDERASSEDSDIGCSSLQSYSNSAKNESSEKLITNSSPAFSIQSNLEEKDELVSSSSDERASSEDRDIGCIMSSNNSSQPDVNCHVINTYTDVAWHNFVNQTEAFFQSLQSEFYRKQSTYPEFKIEQELVSSFSDERATSEDCNTECTCLEAIGPIDLSLRPQYRSTASEQLCNYNLQDSQIKSPNNKLVVSLPNEMTSPVMNVDINDAWDALVNQTQAFYQTVDGLQSTHPKLEENQDERVTYEDSGVVWTSQGAMTSSDMSHKPHSTCSDQLEMLCISIQDNLLMSPNNPLASSQPDEMTSPVINADIAYTTRFFENLLHPQDFCRTPGKNRNTTMTDNSTEEKGFGNPFHIPAFDSPFPYSDRVRKNSLNQNTLASSVGQSDICLNHSIVFESLQQELEDEKDLRQAVEREGLTSLKVERTIWLEKLKNVALNNIKNLEELVKSAGQKDDRYGYSQLKQKIRDWTLHLEFCDQGLIEATQGGLQLITLEKLMDSLQVSSAPISIVKEAPVSPVLLERYESVTRGIQRSFPGYPRNSIITKLEVLKALSGGTLNMFSNYHLIKAITNSIIQDRVQQQNLASNYLASCRRVYYTAPGPRYSCLTSSKRRCRTASRRSSHKSAGQNDEQGPSRKGYQRTTGQKDERGQSKNVGQSRSSKRARKVRMFFL
ncbi:serine-rich adhesin for platelets [Biomphalaria glabrata]|nr:serine-rich adhesin for platelets [Biomphalaria glabrata]